MSSWTVVHYNHDGVALGDVNPGAPEFGMYLGKTGYLNYQLDTSNDLARKDNCEPYYTDFKLFRNKTPIMGGLHTDISIGDDIEAHMMQVAGKDWYHYLDLRFWPFDPVNPIANRYLVTARDVFDIVKDLLDGVLALSNSLSYTYAFGASGFTLDYKIEPGDTETILSRVTSLGQRSPGGFDVDIDHNRVIRLFAPKKGIQRDLVLEQGANIARITYSNSGPKGTHTLGSSHVTSSNISAAVDSINQPRYRRIDYAADVPDIRDPSTIGSIVSGESQRASTPHTEFTLVIAPDYIDDLLGQVSIGDSLKIEADLGWDIINDYYRMVSIIGRPDDEGNEEYELGFDDGTISL